MFLLELYQVYPTGQRPQGRPWTCCGDYILQMALESLENLQKKLEIIFPPQGKVEEKLKND